ncbi:MAG: formate dehydrogenase accessory protein FdhE [Acidobacteriota bacterium]
MRTPLADRWDARIARARTLAAHRRPAAEILSFYAGLAARQQALAARTSERSSRQGACVIGRLVVDRDAVLTSLLELLAWVAVEGPKPLASAAAALARESRERWQAELEACLASHGKDEGGASTGQADDQAAMLACRWFAIEAAIQPLAEAAAAEVSAAPPAREALQTPSRCPRCDQPPLVGTLREEGHGARRGFVCGVCLTEWPAPRLGCPACGESRFEALPVFRADDEPAVRVDACETCKAYLKTIDLTKDGAAEPLVDDLASVSLDLWAREHGYRRTRPNLLRL